MAGSKTAMFSRQTPGGVWNVEDQTLSTGDRFFVCSTTGTDATTNGLSPDSPYATIDYAVGQCSASKGDIIYVMPGHVETVATAAALDFDTAGIKVIGLGWGDIRPKVQLSAQASTVEFNADDMWIENIIFEGTYTGGVTVGLDIKTACDDLVLKDCVIRATAATKELLIGVTIEATNTRITFDGCTFYEFATGDATAAIKTEGAFADLIIQNCEFRGDWSTAVLDLDAAAVTANGLTVRDVYCFNVDASAGLFCTLDNTTVACFKNVHYLGGKGNTPPIPANDDGACYVSECYGTETASTYSVVWPLTATNYGA